MVAQLPAGYQSREGLERIPLTTANLIRRAREHPRAQRRIFEPITRIYTLTRKDSRQPGDLRDGKISTRVRESRVFTDHKYALNIPP